MDSIIADQKVLKRRRARQESARGANPIALRGNRAPAWEFRSDQRIGAIPTRGPAPLPILGGQVSREKIHHRRRTGFSPKALASSLGTTLRTTLRAALSATSRFILDSPRHVALQLARSLGEAKRSSGAASWKLQTGGLEEVPQREIEASARSRTIRILAVAFIAAVIAISTVMILREPSFPLPEGELLPPDPSTLDRILSYLSPEPVGADPDIDMISLPPAPATLDYQSYTVRSGDTLSSVAARFGRSIDTIIALNGITNARTFKTGTEIKIPNMDGLIHKVRAGESIGSISRKYSIDSTRLVDANDLGSAVIRPGQSLFIPGARLPESELRKVFGINAAWPLRGALSSFYGYRANPFTGVRQFHGGIDIVANLGTPVRAALDGRIADVGYNANFGNYVIISHFDGIQTLYAHLTSYAVSAGKKISQGSILGLSGSTGYSTGPHLHFGLYKNGAAQNPLKYLK